MHSVLYPREPRLLPGCSGRFSNCMYAHAAALLQRQFVKTGFQNCMHTAAVALLQWQDTKLHARMAAMLQWQVLKLLN
jgi:hypothetical protein